VFFLVESLAEVTSKVAEDSQVCWYMPVILGLGRLRQEDHEFKASLDFIARPCQKK
jgi:hypothetical protein